jgi:hypothetical protein
MDQFDFSSYSICETPFPDYTGALTGLLMDPHADMTFFHNQYHLVPNNLGFINKDINGNYYVEIDIRRIADILTNFTLSCKNISDVRSELILNEMKININDKSMKILVCAAPYTQFILRFTFKDKPLELIFGFDAYLCKTEIRNRLIRRELICESGIQYYHGVASPKVFDEN